MAALEKASIYLLFLLLSQFVFGPFVAGVCDGKRTTQWSTCCVFQIICLLASSSCCWTQKTTHTHTLTQEFFRTTMILFGIEDAPNDANHSTVWCVCSGQSVEDALQLNVALVATCSKFALECLEQLLSLVLSGVLFQLFPDELYCQRWVVIFIYSFSV